MHWRRKWQPTPVFLPGESQGRGSLGCCHIWGCTELDTTEAIYQQQQQILISKNFEIIWHIFSVFLSFYRHTHIFEASQVALVVKNSPANAGDTRGVGSIPGSGRSLGVGNGSLVQYSCLENSMGIGAWQVIVHGATNPIWCNFQFFINGILLTYSETCYFSHSVVLKIMYIDIFRCSSILHCMNRPRVSLEQGFHIF